MSFWCGFSLVPWHRWWPRLCDNPVCLTTTSVWRLRLCDDPVYVTTTLMWRPCHVALGEVSSFEMVLDIFYSSQWIICSFIVILGTLVLHYFYQSYCVVKEIYFAKFKWKFSNYCMFCKMLIIIKLAFPPPH